MILNNEISDDDIFLTFYSNFEYYPEVMQVLFCTVIVLYNKRGEMQVLTYLKNDNNIEGKIDTIVVMSFFASFFLTSGSVYHKPKARHAITLVEKYFRPSFVLNFTC